MEATQLGHEQRIQTIRQMKEQTFDVIVIGGKSPERVRLSMPSVVG